MLNKLLRRESWARERLQRHTGKTVRFALAGWTANLAVQSDGSVQVSDPAIVPDVTLSVSSGKLADLPKAFRDGDPDQIAALMHIQGDAGLAQTVSELARNLRWDVEDELARIVGDVPAVRIMQGLNAAGGSARRSARRLGENISEYLVDEAEQVLGRNAFDEWSGKLHAAQEQVQRLELRIAGLEAGGRSTDGQGRASTC